MVTKPQDVVVALKFLLTGAKESYVELSKALGMSASEVHSAVGRLAKARLIDPETKEIHREALRNFLVHGVPYSFPVSLGELTRGIPTAWGAPAMSDQFGQSDQLPPVWPDPDGLVQGTSVRPLYPSVPQAARKDSELYALLALVDALRIGRARERNLAQKEISKRLNLHAST